MGYIFFPRSLWSVLVHKPMRWQYFHSSRTKLQNYCIFVQREIFIYKRQNVIVVL